MNETLALDSSYRPVGRFTWQRAVTLLFEGKVEVIESYDREVRSVSVTIKIPAVIRFLKIIKQKSRIIKFNRETLYMRDKGACQYCLKLLTRKEATYDHVMPKARGGKTDFTNVVICCYKCNQKKDCRTPDEARMKLNKVPAKPTYLPNRFTITFSYAKEAPLAWKNWLVYTESE